MKILYGVVGEGMGHAMRSAVVLSHLVERGHDVRIVVSGRAASYLAKLYPSQVTEITGLSMSYEDNEVQKRKTALANLKKLTGLPDNIREYMRMAEAFHPDVVISDFESWAYMFARGQGIPVISVDNMQIIARCRHQRSVKVDRKAYYLAKGLVKAKLPRCNAYLITTFFYPPLKKNRTSLHPPILRDVILKARANATDGAHVLVYQSGDSHGSLVQVLEHLDTEFRVYGLRRDIDAPVREGNILYCPFSEQGFIDDLASCRAVVAGGGFTLMGEAVYLGKPMLSVPLVGQFEQLLNAAYLHELGYGERAEKITAAGLSDFIARAPEYCRNLSRYSHDSNQGLLTALDDALVSAVAEGARF